MTSVDNHLESAPTDSRPRRISRDWLLLGLLWLIHAVALAAWLLLDNRFPVGETAAQLTAALRAADALGRPSLDVLSRIAAASAGQPPLPYLATAPLIWLFGRGPDPATLINLLWLALLLAGVYGITRRLFPLTQSPSHPATPSPIHWPALAAAALVSLYPLVVASIRIYDPALAATALAALAIWLLVESDGLQRRAQAVGFGLAVAAGLLASAVFWAVVLGPALIVALQAVRTPRPARGSRRSPSHNSLERFGRRLRLAPAHVNLLLALLLAGLALPFYLLRPGAGRLPTLPQVGNLLAGLSLWDDITGGLLLLALLVGAVYGAWQVIRPRRNGARLAYGLLLAWLGLGLILLALFGGGVSQWMPLLPAAAVLSVAWVSPTELPTFRKVGNSRSGAIVTGLLVLVAAFNAAIITWGAPAFAAGAAQSLAPKPPIPQSSDHPFAAATNVPLWSPGRALYHRWSPQAAKSQTAAIGQAVDRLCGDQDDCRAVVLSCAPPLSPAAFEYFQAQSGLGARLAMQSLDASVNFYYDLWDADFVVSNAAGHGCTAADGLTDVDLRRMAVTQNALASAEFGQRFRPVESFELPDGAQAQLWRRIGPPISQMDAAEQVLALEHILAVSPNANAANQALSTLLEQIGDPARALALREDIVARNPEDSAARVALGDVYLAYGRPQDAVAQYQAALTGNAPAAAGQSLTGEVLLKLASAQEALGQWDEAEASLTRASEEAPDDYTVRLSQGQFLLRRGRFADAAAALALAREIDPQRFETYIALGQAQLLRNDLQQAQEQFRLAQQAAPDSPEPLLAWADAVAARGDLNQASQLFSQAIDLAGAGGQEQAVIDAYGRWIAALEALGTSQQVTTLAETLVKTYPRSAQALAILAGLYSRQGLQDQALATYQSALELAPQDVSVRVGLAQVLAGLGRYDEADQVVQEGLALPAGRVELLTTQADVLAAQGIDGPLARQAIERYGEALQANPAYWPAAARLAQFFLSRDQASRALQTVDAAAQQWPELYQLHALRGDALRALGRRQDAQAAYRQAIDLAPAPLSTADPVNASLAVLHTRLGELQAQARALGPAEDSFRQALRYDAGQAAAHVGLARVYTALAVQGSAAAASGAAQPAAADDARFRQASDAIDAALALEPDSVAAQTALGNLYDAYGRSEDAIAAYEEALRLDSSQADEARSRLFAIYLAQNRADEVISLYRQLLRENPDSVAAVRGLAAAYIAAGQPEAALEAYDLFLTRPENRDSVAALMAQGETLRDLGQLDEALAAYERAARLTGAAGSVQPQVEQARTLALMGRTDDAEAAYRAIVQRIEDPAAAADLTGDLAQPYVGLARLLLGENRVDEAEAITTAALAAQPDSSAVQLLAGDLSRFQGRRAEALAAFRRALDLAPGSVVAATRIGDLLLEGGNLAEAQTAYEAALANDPTDLSGLLGLARTLSRSVTTGAGPAPSPETLTPEQTASLDRAQQLLDAVLLRLGDQNSDAGQSAQIIRAELLAARGQVAEAADAYQAVLLQDPDNATAIEGLARTLLAAGQADEAIARYQAAADAAETPEGRNRWLMTIAATYRSLERFDEAEQTYLGMIEADPANSAAYQALGDLYQAANRLDEAIAQYRLALQAAPASVDTAFRLGRALLQIGQVDEAAQIAQSLLAASPSAWQPYLLTARVALAQQDPAGALASLRQAQNLAPTNSPALTLIGDSFLSAGRLDDAASAYGAAVALEPRNANALVGLGRIYAARDRTADAETSLRRALAVAPNNLSAQAALGRLLLRAGRPAEAVPVLEAAVAQRADHPTAVRDLADAYLASDRVEEGLAIYRANLNLDEASQQLVIGQALLNAGRVEDGLAELQGYVEGRPDDPAGWLALAQGQQAAGDAGQADAAYQQAVAAAPNDGALRIQYGDFLLAQQEAERAAAAFQAVIDALQQGDRLDEVTQRPAASIDAAGAAPVELWRAWIGLARARQQEGQYDQALQAAEAGEALRPDVPAFALQIGDIQRAAGRSDAALAAYQRAADFGTSTLPFTRMGDLYLRLDQPDRALAAYESALALSANDADALLGLARAYAQRGGGVDQADFANAEARLKRAAQLAPGNVNVSLALGDLYAAYGRKDDAVASYRAALSAQPDNNPAQERLAGALLAAGQLDEALQEQLKLVAQRPGDRGALLTLAIIYRSLGQTAEAEATYRQLLEQTPDDPVVLIALGDMALEQGEAGQAVLLYQRALSNTIDPLVAAQASDQLGKAYLRLGQVEQARAVAEALMRDQPALDRGYLLLGSVYEAQNEPEAALAAYQAGAGQAAETLALQLRLGDLLLRMNRPAEAQEIYDTLTKSNPRSEDAFVGLARAHIAQFPDLQALRTEWVTQALRAALRINPNSTAALTTQGDLYAALERPDDAAAAYGAALASRTAGSGDDSALRLKLAAALAAAGGWEQALQEYQRVAIANPEDVGIQMALGNAYRESGRAQQALAQYQRVNQIAPGYPFAYIRQGEVLDGLGQADQALAAYQAAAAAAPDNADAVLTLAVAYRKRGMVSEAIAAFEAGLAIDPARNGARTALEELRTKGK